MPRRLLHTRIPTVFFMFAFIGAGFGFIRVIAQAQQSPVATPEFVHRCIAWGAACLVFLSAFTVALAALTRHRRAL
jgi:hypothetical protein